MYFLYCVSQPDITVCVSVCQTATAVRSYRRAEACVSRILCPATRVLYNRHGKFEIRMEVSPAWFCYSGSGSKVQLSICDGLGTTNRREAPPLRLGSPLSKDLCPTSTHPVEKSFQNLENCMVGATGRLRACPPTVIASQDCFPPPTSPHHAGPYAFSKRAAEPFRTRHSSVSHPLSRTESRP
jgi:hypothetical protein